MDHGLLSSRLHILARLALAGCIVTLMTACSMGQMVVRGSQTILDSGIVSMNQETDLQLARDAIPANLKLIEGMLIEDPGNTELRLFAAEGFYGYSFGFIESENPARAKQLYRRCYGHAQLALQQAGVNNAGRPVSPFNGSRSRQGRQKSRAGTVLDGQLPGQMDRPESGRHGTGCQSRQCRHPDATCSGAG